MHHQCSMGTIPWHSRLHPNLQCHARKQQLQQLPLPLERCHPRYWLQADGSMLFQFFLWLLLDHLQIISHCLGRGLWSKPSVKLPLHQLVIFMDIIRKITVKYQGYVPESFNKLVQLLAISPVVLVGHVFQPHFIYSPWQFTIIRSHLWITTIVIVPWLSPVMLISITLRMVTVLVIPMV